MSLSRCFTTALRSRRALERTLLPAASAVTGFNKVAEDEARGKLYYAPTAQSQVGHVRHYSKRASRVQMSLQTHIKYSNAIKCHHKSKSQRTYHTASSGSWSLSR
ncbi:hypothetical protein C7M84_016529 [Penaeus vannamei]|uniref:Uncharacterized protein n=1 Tax=Penaeus vannamei TaxID=6689 RepID=A0A3R7QF58_PENVA|nr:hypothetical protein C7M84_016529 [Penaeus vannamei]